MISVNLIPGFMAYINHVAPHGLEIACSGIFIVGQFDHPKGTFFLQNTATATARVAECNF